MTEWNPMVGVQQDAERRGADGGGGHEQLVERVDAQQVLFGHEQGHGRHHGGAVERLPDAARHHQHHQQAERDLAEQDDDAQRKRHQPHAEVGGGS